MELSDLVILLKAWPAGSDHRLDCVDKTLHVGDKIKGFVPV